MAEERPPLASKDRFLIAHDTYVFGVLYIVVFSSYDQAMSTERFVSDSEISDAEKLTINLRVSKYWKMEQHRSYQDI